MPKSNKECSYATGYLFIVYLTHSIGKGSYSNLRSAFSTLFAVLKSSSLSVNNLKFSLMNWPDIYNTVKFPLFAPSLFD